MASSKSVESQPETVPIRPTFQRFPPVETEGPFRNSLRSPRVIKIVPDQVNIEAPSPTYTSRIRRLRLGGF